MDFVTDIETPLLYWVGRIEESPDDDLRLWGTSPAGTYGFGGEERSYTGDVFIISDKGRREEKNLSIMQGHVNSQGFFWSPWGNPKPQYPEPPFLMTNDPALRLIRKQEISFTPYHNWRMLNDMTIPVEGFWVCCPDWMGWLQVDKTKSNHRGILWLFSDRPDVTIEPGTELMFCSNPDEVFVTVTHSDGTTN